MSRNIVWNTLKINGLVFTLEQTPSERYIATKWNPEMELKIDRDLTCWETPGGAAQELLNMIQEELRSQDRQRVTPGPG